VSGQGGFWFDVGYIETALRELDNRELFSILHELSAESHGQWVFMPFSEQNDDSELYEDCHPGEGAASFGRAVNVPARFTPPRAALRLRTIPGTRLGDYVRSGYAALLSQERPRLGGENIIATTLFQMNHDYLLDACNELV
jgi:hypothetical protein